ncbi:MAG: polya polymerase [Oscillospiraceae bacterium]|nr:polya polymerase [Oscillospiraceae bacterium]MBQ5749269.1 polya polymerase [Oscillospiraceae bacterium]
MKIKNIKEVEAFRQVVRECTSDVYLKSQEGDVFNLKSAMSEYIALGRLLSEAGDSLELFASNREDEAKLLAFVEGLDA